MTDNKVWFLAKNLGLSFAFIVLLPHGVYSNQLPLTDGTYQLDNDPTVQVTTTGGNGTVGVNIFVAPGGGTDACPTPHIHGGPFNGTAIDPAPNGCGHGTVSLLSSPAGSTEILNIFGPKTITDDTGLKGPYFPLGEHIQSNSPPNGNGNPNPIGGHLLIVAGPNTPNIDILPTNDIAPNRRPKDSNGVEVTDKVTWWTTSYSADGKLMVEINFPNGNNGDVLHVKYDPSGGPQTVFFYDNSFLVIANPSGGSGTEGIIIGELAGKGIGASLSLTPHTETSPTIQAANIMDVTAAPTPKFR